MALTKLTDDLNIIANLDDEPNDAGGLTAAAFKEKFDSAGNSIKTFLNDTMIPEIEAQKATKEEVQNVVLGQIPDGSLTAAKMVSDIAINPTAHKSTHAIGGSDTLKSTDLGIDATTAAKFISNPQTVDAALAEAAGDFKSYGTNSVADLNSFMSLGSALFTSAVANSPPGASVYASVWNVSGYGGAYLVQKYFDAVSRKLHRRSYVDGTWGTWGREPTIGGDDPVAVQIASGSYVGTGAYASANPTPAIVQIPLAFTPKLFILSTMSGNYSPGLCITWPYLLSGSPTNSKGWFDFGAQKGMTVYTNLWISSGNLCIANSPGVSTDPMYACNVSGITYSYMYLG